MRKLTILSLCLLFTIPCGAATITVEAPQPVSLTIEADDFSDGTDISTVYDDITLSYNGGPVYAVTSILANGQLGTNVIAHSLGDELWGPGEQFRIDFNGSAKSISIEVIASSDSTGWVTVRIEAYNSDGELIDSDEETQIHKDYTHTLNIGREYFDIAYVIVYADTPGRYMCLDEANVNFLPDYPRWADFDKIQDAIDYRAVDGDVIEVWPGTYYERINFYGLAVTVTSIDPSDPNIVAATVIDTMGGGVGVRFSSLEDRFSVLTGFTIQNANDGIYCYFSDPLIMNCVVRGNSVAGIYCNRANPTIVNSIIQDNPGAGIMGNEVIEDDLYPFGAEPLITDCVIKNNWASGLELCRGHIENCLISSNLENGLKFCGALVENCIISGNFMDGVLSAGLETGCIPEYPALISNCTIVGNKGHGVNKAVMAVNNSIIVNNWSSGVNAVVDGVSGDEPQGEETIYHAVVCGIADYEVIGDLLYTDNDAHAFRDALLAWPNWDEENIKVLVDSDANALSIATAIGEMSAAADEDDVCVFFFSGHGGAAPDLYPYDESDEYDEFLCAYDFHWGESCEPVGAIIDDDFSEWMAELPTDKYAVFINACHSGGMIKAAVDDMMATGVGSFVPEKGDGFAADLTLTPGMVAQDLEDNNRGVVVTACDDDEVCYMSHTLQHGVFTYYLLEGMAGPADANNNDRISAEECYFYTAPRATIFQSRQHAQMYDGHPGELEFLTPEPTGGAVFRYVLSHNNIWGNLKDSYSNVEPGKTDIHKDPFFAVEGYWAGEVWVEGDYHLMSSAGRWDPNNQTWVPDDISSPCIDAGDPKYDVGSEPNPNGARVNMGRYGGTTEASKSPSGIVEPVCLRHPAMDFNGDCKVDLVDFAMFTQSWLDCNIDPQEACWQ